MKMLPLIALAALLPLAGCAAGERGVVSAHQPIVTAVGASVPNCPDWSDRDLPMSEGQSSNYGCATAVNLAAMIADPADLVRGRTDASTGTDPALAARAIKSWRETGTTGKQGVDKTSSKGS
ncbi:CpaD family pilus assembly lipoprotein [Sphingomonas sp. BIUV-7]|uniref:CpaD family pilus assembly lipoprotein n=1 Tax=Sphingomonas natans TaxID=3063330 RepID=A0ABT8Y4C7_9SPHN|nr:CpaD family pilus assembly lipoprotein [Sphingomonas sp. BIUV-7]MDO6413171.1 CpaD family pilus assembly lipoprotein [Sphingomonas sp. BIUV-7]